MAGRDQDSSQPTRRPRRRADLTVHELDGEALIFDSSSGDTHRLNETALFIWRSCDGAHNAELITKVLTAEYDVSQAEARSHVESTLDRLRACALLENSISDAVGGGTVTR